MAAFVKPRGAWQSARRPGGRDLISKFESRQPPDRVLTLQVDKSNMLLKIVTDAFRLACMAAVFGGALVAAVIAL